MKKQNKTIVYTSLRELKEIGKEFGLHITQSSHKWYLYRLLGSYGNRDDMLAEFNALTTITKDKLTYSQLANSAGSLEVVGKALAYKTFNTILKELKGVKAPAKLASYLTEHMMDRYKQLYHSENTPKKYLNLTIAIDAVCDMLTTEYLKDNKLKKIHRGLVLTDTLSYKSIIEVYLAKNGW